VVDCEYDAFKLFYCDKVYETILKATEARYHEYYMDSVYAYCHGYTKTMPLKMELFLHERELDAYFSVQMFFGVVRLSNIRDYFRQSKKNVDRRQ
jgi:Transposase IS4